MLNMHRISLHYLYIYQKCLWPLKKIYVSLIDLKLIPTNLSQIQTRMFLLRMLVYDSGLHCKLIVSNELQKVVPHGKGLLKSKDGKFYEGEFLSGKKLNNDSKYPIIPEKFKNVPNSFKFG